ncbi:fumarate hydratase [Endomicrobium proavitum]|uniref:Fumarate hydratase n=1 Tax=Endomicrobium proavitum TaxID=1408281 RepID=A0A0G3WJ91_9BACT|nr:fumarate hydratase [Endomicrobium proavitum]AKL97534.1 fumarate hydratase [Endomicrobium proavitum]
MRIIKSSQITKAVERLCAEANYNLPHDVLNAVKKSAAKEKGVAKNILTEIIENAKVASKENIPLCQDTGTANFFINLGSSVKISGADIYKAVNDGVGNSYKKNYLRKSIVSDPLTRKNTCNNTPANIYINIVSGDKIEITFLPKGGGSENASALKMLAPSAGWQGAKDFILSAIKEKGANACPPLIIGVGIGGDFASVGKLAKESLLRKIGSKNKTAFYAKKEKELLEEINNLNIGPMGLGGQATALAVFISVKPCHIASFPVAVSIQCHSNRRKTVLI